MLWHMDDLKASCTNSWEITKLFLYLKKDLLRSNDSAERGAYWIFWDEFRLLGGRNLQSVRDTVCWQDHAGIPRIDHKDKPMLPHPVPLQSPTGSPGHIPTRSKQLSSTTLWPNWCFCKSKQDVIFKWQHHSCHHKSKDQIKTTGASSGGCFNSWRVLELWSFKSR